MKAARIAAPRKWEFVDVDLPSPDDGDVLLKMEYYSVCGSDLRTYDRVLPEEQYPMRIGGPCHELVGIVEESRDDRIKRGQRVIALSPSGGGGGLQEYIIAAGSRVVPVPDGIFEDPAYWVLCQPVGTVLWACQQMGAVIGKRVAVIGQGPIGMGFAEFISRGMARQVIVTDLLDYRLEHSKRIGATHTINASRENVPERVAEITDGEMCDIVVECVGRPETTNQTFDLLKRQGLAVIFGMTHNEDTFEVEWSKLYSKLPHMIVTNSAMVGENVTGVKMCVDLVKQGRLDLSYLLTHQMSWFDVQRAYDTYSGKLDNSLKVVMKGS
jgi:L-iditol 2-dehydrogenase